MSVPPPAAPPPSDPRVAVVLVTALAFAVIVAASGFLSLALDRDVVDYADAGPLLGPAMVAAVLAVTAAGCARATRSRSPWVAALLTGLAAFAAAVLVGAGGYTLVRGDATWLVLAGAHFAASPFVAIAAVVAALAVVGAWAMTRGGARGSAGENDR